MGRFIDTTKKRSTCFLLTWFRNACRGHSGKEHQDERLSEQKQTQGPSSMAQHSIPTGGSSSNGLRNEFLGADPYYRPKRIQHDPSSPPSNLGSWTDTMSDHSEHHFDSEVGLVFYQKVSSQKWRIRVPSRRDTPFEIGPKNQYEHSRENHQVWALFHYDRFGQAAPSWNEHVAGTRVTKQHLESAENMQRTR